MNKKKLKNCPFCGSKPKCDNGFSPLESVYYVWCDNVDCILSPYNGDDRLFDVDLWNERSWWYVTMPFWGGSALFLAIIAIVFLFAGIATVLKSR